MDSIHEPGKMHRVRAHQAAQGWRLEIIDGGEVWVQRLTDAMKATRALIATEHPTEKDAIHVQLDVELAEPFKTEFKNAVNLTLEARRAQEAASEAYRRVAANLHATGITGADISLILGVSRQRVSQLLAKEQLGGTPG
ncbi:hypothetical protein AB0K86_19655 [Streptomyces clavifer]|uniref:hypothetical protein n=1 Tax=Streptomyces TaxID=1883 RepID=UPI0012FECEF0|nr:hypothetical protein [Streptomyces sp. Root55]